MPTKEQCDYVLSKTQEELAELPNEELCGLLGEDFYDLFHAMLRRSTRYIAKPLSTTSKNGTNVNGGADTA